MNGRRNSSFVVMNFAGLQVAGLNGNGVSSDELLDSTGRLTIIHSGEAYELRKTRSGKLILTK